MNSGKSNQINGFRDHDHKGRSAAVATNRFGFIDGTVGREVSHCYGPASDGSCPRVQMGEVVACAGYGLRRTGATSGLTYEVTPHMTLCPVTLAAAVDSDSALLP